MKKQLIITLLISLFLIACSGNKQEAISFEAVKDFDIAETIIKATREDKKVLIYFSSIACPNCRKMEENVLLNSNVQDLILTKFIFVPLLVDDKSIAERSYWKQSKFHNDTLKRIGQLYSELQIELTQSGSQPQFAIVSKENEVLSHRGSTMEVEVFMDFLKN